MLWSRFWAIVIGFAAISLLYWFITGAGDKALGSTIFIIAIGLALLLLARHLWRNQDGLAETLGGGTSPTRRSRSPENR